MSGYLERLAVRMTGTGPYRNLSPSSTGVINPRRPVGGHPIEQSGEWAEEAAFGVDGQTASGTRFAGFEHRGGTDHTNPTQRVAPNFPENRADSPASHDPGEDAFEHPSAMTARPNGSVSAASDSREDSGANLERTDPSVAPQNVLQAEVLRTVQGEGAKPRTTPGTKDQLFSSLRVRKDEVPAPTYQPFYGVDDTRLPGADLGEMDERASKTPARRFFRDALDTAVIRPQALQDTPNPRAETETPSQLSPRQVVVPPSSAPSSPAEQPRLVIGRLTVEVVQQKPGAERPVYARAPVIRRSSEAPSSNRQTGPGTKLNFGLGQV